MLFNNKTKDIARLELTNRLFFKLYQCANMLHKTGSRAVEEEGLTTQQWAVLGALSREGYKQGMSITELATYLMVTRQNLSSVVNRMTRDNYLESLNDPKDGRSRLVRMTEHGRKIWEQDAQVKIKAYYEEATKDLSTTDLVHILHYLVKLLDNLQTIDAQHKQEND
jgi:DNA-binding MarR family transcriptional regulator